MWEIEKCDVMRASITFFTKILGTDSKVELRVAKRHVTTIKTRVKNLHSH
jgi:hypothetical protein